MRLKDLELAWKRFLFRVIRSYLNLRPTPETPDWSTGRRRVLFLRQDRLGDAIVSTGLLRAIVGLSSEIELDVLGSPRNEALLRRLPYVRHVHVFDKKRPRSFPGLWRRLRGAGYDMVIDCMVTAPSMTGLLLMLSTGAPHRVGVGGRGVDWGLTVPIPPAEGHIIDLLSVFIRAFGADPEAFDWSPELPLADEERRWAEGEWEGIVGEGARRVLVNVSAGEARRGWPDAHYVAVVRELADREDLRVLVVGAPSEWERVESIAGAAGARVVPTPTIDRIIALVATADHVFTPDTSLVHMASAFRKPTLAMYVQGTSSQWGPFGVAAWTIESEEESLANLPLAPVLALLRQMLDGEEGAGKGESARAGAAADAIAATERRDQSGS